MTEAIVCDPEIMHSVPVFRGTGVPVQTLVDYVDWGDPLEDFLEAFPTVRRTLALQALEEAKQLTLWTSPPRQLREPCTMGTSGDAPFSNVPDHHKC